MEEDYYKREKERLESERDKYRDSVDRWKIAFGWITVVAVFLLIILIIGNFQYVQQGYTPEEVADVAIKICRALA